MTGLASARIAGALVAACVLAAAAGARAQSLAEAEAAFHDGRFLEAADLGEAIGTSDALAMAAAALAIHGYYLADDGDKQPLFKRGMALAEKAVALDGGNAWAHFQTSHTMGRYAQTLGVLEALSEGYAGRIRAALDAALALDPDMMQAHLSLGAWHAEIVASAGFIMAAILYGASEEDALAHYERAYALAPDDSTVNLEFAIGLVTLDDDDYVERARSLLAHAAELPAEDAYGRIVRAQAEARLAALGGG
jgi:hypothetical protein